jgi:hypothetical protein
MFGLVLVNRSLAVFKLPQNGQGRPEAMGREAVSASDSLLGGSSGFIFHMKRIDECFIQI